MAEPLTLASPPRIRRAWPWLVLSLAVVPAIWHVVDFPEDVDGEWPGVERPTFNRMPPPAYRLAEPGDTIDRVAIYFAAAGTALAGVGLARSRGRVGLWPAGLALAVAGLWQAATPGPTFDGWHGLGWRVLLDPGVPASTRLPVAAGAIGLAAVVVANLATQRRRLGGLWREGEAVGVRGLLIASGLLILARQGEIPRVEPAGYWPRWAYDWGILSLDLALIRCLGGQGLPGRVGRVGWGAAIVGVWFGLVAGGVDLSRYHRPLSRLRTVEPGKVYISAMPTYAGLEVAQARHHFKTIINLFPEDIPELRSPLLDDERRFARERGIRYIQALAADNNSDEFMGETLAVALDPAAWPVLVHCHGCMDRSPAWMGIYRFVVQGRPLLAILREIEAHRGVRPKASITLIFNRVLALRAPERYLADPTAALLREYAHGNKIVPYPAATAATASREGEKPAGR